MIRYDIPIDDYHAAEYISASKLGTFADLGPAAYHSRYIARTDPPREPTQAMVFGQAFEDLLQDSESWAEKYVVRPAGMKFTSKEGKAWRSEQKLLVLDTNDREAMDSMQRAIAANSTALYMINACDKLQPTGRIDVDVLPGIQSRPDWYCTNGHAVSGFTPFSLDLKTTSDFTGLVSGRSVAKWRYHVQAALVKHCFDDCDTYLLAVESQAPYRCQVVEITDAWTDIGRAWAGRQIDKIAACYESSRWPSVEQDSVALPAPPKWLSNEGE